MLVVIRSDGVEAPVQEVRELVREVGLEEASLPIMRDRGAVAKALHSLKVMPAARHRAAREEDENGDGGEDTTCLRYSRVNAPGGNAVFSIRRERVEHVEGGLPQIVDDGEVQRLAYFAESKTLEVLRGDLLKDELQAAYAHYLGSYKSDSIRSFVDQTLADAGAIKFAGSTWFIPESDGARDTLPRLRKFCRGLPSGGMTILAVAVMDEPGGKGDLVVSARASVESELAALQKRLGDCEARRKQGVNVKGDTMDKILEEGRELREKLRTLATLLDLESRGVAEKLDELDVGVRAFLGA